jgi:hypothetical protein
MGRTTPLRSLHFISCQPSFSLLRPLAASFGTLPFRLLPHSSSFEAVFADEDLENFCITLISHGCLSPRFFSSPHPHLVRLSVSSFFPCSLSLCVGLSCTSLLSCESCQMFLLVFFGSAISGLPGAVSDTVWL